jgi:hypothetical protein
VTNPNNQTPLLTPRSAMILLLGLLCGVGAGLLTAWSGAHTGQAILTGGASAGAGVVFFHWLIDRS